MKSIRTLRDSTSGLDDYLASKSPGEGWEKFRSHQGGKAYRELAETLETLQHGLCGYCEINLIDLDRQIEHVIPQSDPKHGEAKSLDVANMIACCTGGTQKNIFGPDARGDEERYLPSSKSSCGEVKGNASDPAFVDPRTLPALPSLTKVHPNGLIEVDEDACDSTGVSASHMAKTIDRLRLNTERLRLARERRWEALSDVWGQDYDNPEAMDLAARSELLPDETGRLPRFFTTSRTYFSGYGEKVLAEEPQGVDLKDNTFFAPSPRGSRHRLAPKLAETGTLRLLAPPFTCLWKGIT